MGINYQPTEQVETNKLTGVYPATVTDNEDEANKGRVKLDYPWQDGDDESVWARVATPMASEEMGMYFLPEEGDEVLVTFQDGDIHEPYVIGSLWNGEHEPPESNDGENDVRKIVSRAGHEIVFDDEDDEGAIEINASDEETQIVLDGEEGEIEIGDSNNNRVLLNSKGITVKSKKKLKLDAKEVQIVGDLDVDGAVEIDGSGFEVSCATGDIEMEGMQVSVEAMAMMELSSSAMLEVDGMPLMLN